MKAKAIRIQNYPKLLPSILIYPHRFLPLFSLSLSLLFSLLLYPSIFLFLLLYLPFLPMLKIYHVDADANYQELVLSYIVISFSSLHLLSLHFICYCSYELNLGLFDNIVPVSHCNLNFNTTMVKLYNSINRASEIITIYMPKIKSQQIPAQSQYSSAT